MILRSKQIIGEFRYKVRRLNEEIFVTVVGQRTDTIINKGTTEIIDNSFLEIERLVYQHDFVEEDFNEEEMEDIEALAYKLLSEED